VLRAVGPQGSAPHQIRDKEKNDSAQGDQKLTQAANDGSHD
jgi:hypothetical protein